VVSLVFISFVPKQCSNIPCEDVQADSLPPNIVPVPPAHVRVLARLDAHILAGWLELPCAAQDIDACCGAVEGCGVVEALAGGEGADGVEGGEGRVSGKDVRVHAIEHDAVEDLEDEIHGCGVCYAECVDWRCRIGVGVELLSGRRGRSKSSSQCREADVAKQA